MIRDRNSEDEHFSTPPSTPKSNGSITRNQTSAEETASTDVSSTTSEGLLKEVTDMLQSTQVGNNGKPTSEAGPPSAGSNHSASHISSASHTSSVAPTEPTPTAPPRKGRSDRKNLIPRKSSATSPPRVSANGLPPTPKVVMGACFSKVFNECPLSILCSASWVHPDTHDQHILLGCEEGLYTLNLNELHDACIDQLFPRRTTWLYVIKDILMTLSGKTVNLYRHDLVLLHSKTPLGNNKLRDQVDQVINKIPEKFVPWKSSASIKIPDTKACYNCCVSRNPYNGYKYLAGASPSGIFLMQWYNPLNKFMLLKVRENSLISNIAEFSLILP